MYDAETGTTRLAIDLELPWTCFHDMHSGGHLKLPPYRRILIQAPEPVAIAYFQARFERDPYYVTCRCCGEDYDVDGWLPSEPEEPYQIDQLTAYDRHCRFDNELQRYVEKLDPRHASYADHLALFDFLELPDVLVIIPPKEVRDGALGAPRPQAGS